MIASDNAVEVLRSGRDQSRSYRGLEGWKVTEQFLLTARASMDTMLLKRCAGGQVYAGKLAFRHIFSIERERAKSYYSPRQRLAGPSCQYFFTRITTLGCFIRTGLLLAAIALRLSIDRVVCGGRSRHSLSPRCRSKGARIVTLNAIRLFVCVAWRSGVVERIVPISIVISGW